MQIGSITQDDLVQFVTLLASAIGVAVFGWWMRHSGRPGYAVAPLSYFAHRIIFYAALTVWPNLDNADVVMWSSALSLHSVLTILIGGAAMVQVIRVRLRRHEC